MEHPHPRKIATTLTKRRVGEDRPYETVETASYFEADGTEVTDPARQAEIEAALGGEEETDGIHGFG